MVGWLGEQGRLMWVDGMIDALLMEQRGEPTWPDLTWLGETEDGKVKMRLYLVDVAVLACWLVGNV